MTKDEEIAALKKAFEPILKCKWTRVASDHGTEWGEDPQFDELVTAIDAAQKRYEELYK